ncbi:hypothetical protein EX30DRAFT_207153 [Ascodesmis nigricans]|uniref:Uncharacterized protein n=1 Tax=Ascodesmis nigricans TaxID=341454 RepID=A0A4S2MJU5_9PEZI|nr:hypothetical protein EX30DRAFT_207153 [Ascodesmis nigricans]
MVTGTMIRCQCDDYVTPTSMSIAATTASWTTWLMMPPSSLSSAGSVSRIRHGPSRSEFSDKSEPPLPSRDSTYHGCFLPAKPSPSPSSRLSSRLAHPLFTSHCGTHTHTHQPTHTNTQPPSIIGGRGRFELNPAGT